MGDQIQNADVPAYIDSFVPLVLRSWRGQDFFFGNDRNRTMRMAENDWPVSVVWNQARRVFKSVDGRMK